MLDYAKKLNCVKRVDLHSTIVKFITKTPVVLPINLHIDMIDYIENLKKNDKTDKS